MPVSGSKTEADDCPATRLFCYPKRTNTEPQVAEAKSEVSENAK
jgi:hypothetical protein